MGRCYGVHVFPEVTNVPFGSPFHTNVHLAT